MTLATIIINNLLFTPIYIKKIRDKLLTLALDKKLQLISPAQFHPGARSWQKTAQAGCTGENR